MRPARLSDREIERELGTLPGWTRRGDAITKTFTFTLPAGWNAKNCHVVAYVMNNSTKVIYQGAESKVME